MDGHPPKRCGGTPESSRLPPPQLGGRRATHFSFRNQPRRSTAVFCQANQKRFSFQVRLTALPKEARGTSPFDGDGHEALESVARHRVRRGTPPPHSALRLALDGDVQRGRLGPRVSRLPMDRDLRQRGLQLPRVDRVGGDVRAFLLLEVRSDGRVIFTRDNRFATYLPPARPRRDPWRRKRSTRPPRISSSRSHSRSSCDSENSCGSRPAFSAPAALAVPMIGVLAFGRLEGVGPSFLAALASACLFGLASIFHFGPD